MCEYCEELVDNNGLLMILSKILVNGNNLVDNQIDM